MYFSGGVPRRGNLNSLPTQALRQEIRVPGPEPRLLGVIQAGNDRLY